MELQPLSKTKTSAYAMLRQKKQRDKSRLFIAEGRKCVEELLGHFELDALILRQGCAMPQGFESKAFVADDRQLEKISSFSSLPDCIAVFKMPSHHFEAPQVADPDDLVLVLDDIQDPGNLGTIVRAADWFGIRKVYASEGTADIFGPKCVQATMGALARVAVEYGDIEELLKGRNVPVYGTLLEGDNLYDAELRTPSFLVMGNEGNGISKSIREIIDKGLRIPDYSPDGNCSESLNVAVATAVTIAEFRRRGL